MVPIRAESDDLQRYLAHTDVIDWRTPEIPALARRLTAECRPGVERAQLLYEWVRDRIPHTKDSGGDVVTCRASEVLREGTGICYAKAHLLAALLRAAGIPAGFCYQVLRQDPPYTGLILHGLNGIYLAELGRWVRADARGNTGDVDAQFRTEGEQLAFPMDLAEGELLYETVWVEPAPSVVAALTRYEDRSALWANLPGPL